MVRMNLLVVLMLGIAGAVVAQGKAQKPKGLPPEFVTVAAMNKAQGVLDLEYTVVIGLQYMRIQSEYEVNGERRPCTLAAQGEKSSLFSLVTFDAAVGKTSVPCGPSVPAMRVDQLAPSI